MLEEKITPLAGVEFQGICCGTIHHENRAGKEAVSSRHVRKLILLKLEGFETSSPAAWKS